MTVAQQEPYIVVIGVLVRHQFDRMTDFGMVQEEPVLQEAPASTIDNEFKRNLFFKKQQHNMSLGRFCLANESGTIEPFHETSYKYLSSSIP